MKIVQFNAGLSGSPGMLMRAILEEMDAQGIDNRMMITYGREDHANVFKYASDKEIKINALKSRIAGNWGFEASAQTQRALAFLEEYRPDLIHVHNIHGHDLVFDDFFAYIAKKEVPVVYTFHDCWAFTGYCTHYVSTDCTRYREACHDCPQYRAYSWFRDRSTENQNRKKNALLGLPSLTIVTPSQWMADQVQTSFLKDVPAVVIPNGIDTDTFRPVDSDVRQRLSIGGRKMILSVANAIGKDKGLEDILKLNDMLSDGEAIVLVGINDEVKKELPESIIALPRTNSQAELAEYYSAADVLVNPTHEDTFPTVNIEALACGTPVVTYNTGGSPEAIDECTGMVVPEGDTAALRDAILSMNKNEALAAACRERALKHYDRDVFTRRMIGLYRDILESRE